MEISVLPLRIPEALVFEPGLIADERGYLFEAWNAAVFRDAVGPYGSFVQDNQSRSARGVLRGLHYQLPNPQGKLVRAISGRAWSVGVDLRRSSATFGEWVSVELSAASRNQLWLPPGFAHGLLALEDATEIIYKVTAYFAPGCDRSIRWDDPDLDVAWPLEGLNPVISEKDRLASPFAAAKVYD